MFQKIDCLRLYVENLEKGIKFYRDVLGLKIEWRTEHEVGFILGDGVGEIVIQNIRNENETDLMVENVDECVQIIKSGGGSVLVEPFDIKIGKCAVVKDPFGNILTILDSSKGKLEVDKDKNVIGNRKE